MKIAAEYIWIDGTKPTALCRSKTKVIDSQEEPPVWGFDGSSTNQASTEASDCVLNPVYSCHDPIRAGNNILVLCEVLETDLTPHPTNTRATCQAASEKHAEHEFLFGIEQEYTLYDGLKPLGWPNKGGFPAPQGGYYCGVGADEVYGRQLVELHLDVCMRAGLDICGVNAEVMPAQWEFQIGPIGPLEAADQLWVARWLLYRLGESRGISARLHPKPVEGDWNGAGAHTNVSTKQMRSSYEAILAACKALAETHSQHIVHYGADNEQRLTGRHETCRIDEFRYEVSDRGASVRIPWQTQKDGKGYIEDRRPAANADPYVVNRLLVETIGEVMS